MKLLYRIADRLRRIYWFVVRPTTRGVKCVISYDGSVLMIRNSYGPRRWTFPGGRIGRGEDPDAAARREALEEVGIRLGSLTFIGTYSNNRAHKHDTVYCYTSSAPDPSHEVDGREVSEARWFRLPSLPIDRAPSVDQVMALLERATPGR